jgi:hypothetical protein
MPWETVREHLMQFSRFATDEKPWCVWDWDLKDLTATFLKTFDPTYFEYLANLHVERLEAGDARHAATAIRTTYCHAMETLFALLGAIVQAPDCVPGWIQKYGSKDLRQIVEKISKGREVHSKVRAERLTWDSLAEITLKYISLPDKEKEKRIKTGFASLWRRLADDFLSSEIRAEYNGIKHGFRTASGGSWISVGQEESPGVPCPPEKMQVVGGSEFGSTFFEPEELCKHNLRLVRRAVNWDPFALAGRIRLIARSLGNLVSFLSIGHGAEPGSVQFQWPGELDDFDEVWEGPSLHNSSSSTIIEMKDIVPKRPEEILSVYTPAADKKEGGKGENENPDSDV